MGGDRTNGKEINKRQTRQKRQEGRSTNLEHAVKEVRLLAIKGSQDEKDDDVAKGRSPLRRLALDDRCVEDCLVVAADVQVTITADETKRGRVEILAA